MSTHPFAVPYLPNTDSDRQEMLKAIGVDSAGDLFRDIPPKYRNPSLNLPAPLSEMELLGEVGSMAQQNLIPGEYACFLGGGAYRHYIPSVVRQIVSRGEFMTSYTPYQPEVSQGTLQATYEFQSLICQLTGMEVANAGMYDGASSFAEAALMACRLTKRDRIAVLDTVSPSYREVLVTYALPQGLQVDTVTPGTAYLEEGTACLLVQSPNFLGYLEELEHLSRRTHDQGALLVVATDPIYLGMFRTPGDYDADIVTAEGQPLGVPLSFGGPYVGIFACKEKYLRQMPGRIVGRTLDSRGREGYVLTLQTREQHIRRERATSNICTSEALVALAATVYLSALGKRGLRQVAELCYHKAHYASSLISQIPGYSLPVQGTFFKEFVIRCPLPPHEINTRLLEHGIIGGLDISAHISDGMLLCFTEMNTREEIESLVGVLAEVGKRA
ncbi:MAG: aminomethyl-transferring glycine dehydrogenase subunit GcvPA [Chloroflexi bacterium]|nr:aminomethyl-transferring glycine dehydrogenase subunit GcvPA [Chloroflexota bacterium]